MGETSWQWLFLARGLCGGECKNWEKVLRLLPTTHKHVWKEESVIRMQVVQTRGWLELNEKKMRRLWQEWRNSSWQGWYGDWSKGVGRRLGERNSELGPGVKNGLLNYDCYVVKRRERDEGIGLRVRQGSLGITFSKTFFYQKTPMKLIGKTYALFLQ